MVLGVSSFQIFLSLHTICAGVIGLYQQLGLCSTGGQTQGLMQAS